MDRGFLTCMDVVSGQCWQINDNLQLIQQPAVHYTWCEDGRPETSFIRISEMPIEEQASFNSWIASCACQCPCPEGETGDCVYPQDYTNWVHIGRPKNLAEQLAKKNDKIVGLKNAR